MGDAYGVFGFELEAVEFKEEFHGHEGCTLVAIDEGMVANDAGGAGGGKLGGIRVAPVGKEIFRAGEGGAEKVQVADACGAAMLD